MKERKPPPWRLMIALAVTGAVLFTAGLAIGGTLGDAMAIVGFLLAAAAPAGFLGAEL